MGNFVILWCVFVENCVSLCVSVFIISVYLLCYCGNRVKLCVYVCSCAIVYFSVSVSGLSKY